MRHLIVSGKLPCTKDECAMLAAIQWRLYELDYLKMLDDDKDRGTERTTVTSETAKQSRQKKSGGRHVSALCSSRGMVESPSEMSQISSTNHANGQSTSKFEPSNAIEEVDEEALVDKESPKKQSTPSVTAPTKTTTTTTKTTTVQVIKKKANDDKSSKRNSSIVTTLSQQGLNMPVLANNGCESMFIYLKSCSCFSYYPTSRIITLNKIVSSNYQRCNDIMKLIKVFVFSPL